MKRLLFSLAALLLPSVLLAQPGVTGGTSGYATIRYAAADPTGTCSIRSLHWNTTTNVLWICESGTWISTLAAAGTSFPLLAPNGSETATSYSFASAPGAGLFQEDPNEIRLQAIADAILLRMSADSFDVDMEGAPINTDVSFRLRDAASNAFLSFTNVATPTNAITMAQDTATTPSLTTQVTDGTATNTAIHSASSHEVVVTDGSADGLLNVGTSSFTLATNDGFLNQSTIQADATPSAMTTVSDGTNTSTILNFASSITTRLEDATGPVSTYLTVRGFELPTFTAPDAATITPRGNILNVAGPTAITGITAVPNDGQCIVLIFSANVTVTDGANLHLAGGVNFAATADDTLSLCTNGTASWYETGRSVN